LSNGDLLNAAEAGNPQLPILRLHISRIAAAVDAASPGSHAR
jgi:hypothetical protein